MLIPIVVATIESGGSLTRARRSVGAGNKVDYNSRERL